MSSEKRSKKKYLPYKVYIPENLPIEELLKTNPPIFTKRPKRFQNYRDAIIYIIHLVNAIPRYQKDFDYDETSGFTPINKQVLSNRVHEYRAYIDYLITNNIVIEGSNYIVASRSTGLKFCSLYITPVKAVKITTTTLIKSIVSKNFNRDYEAEKKLAFLKSWFNGNFTIDYSNALEFLKHDKYVSREKTIKKRATKNLSIKQLGNLPPIEDVVMMGYISKLMTVNIINEAEFKDYLSIDKKTGRFHTPLTQLKKGLRKYLRYNGEVLANVDIVNSQPLLSLILLDLEIFNRLNIKGLIEKYNPHFNINYYNLTDKEGNPYNPNYTMLVKLISKNSQMQDVIDFKNSIITGTFYEVFGVLLQKHSLIPMDIMLIGDEQKRNEEIRGFAKKATFRAFFEKTAATKWCPFVRAFKCCFPNVYKVFQSVKVGKGYHNTLACIFQRFESHLILHRTCLDIYTNYPHIPILTIHDSIATTTQYVDIVKTHFETNLKLWLGITPKLNIEIWE